MTEIQTFSSGANSSEHKPRYDLIPQFALARIARRFELGAAKYSEENWKQGLHDKDFIIDRLNHAVEHLLKAMEKIKGQTRIAALDEDDDLAAACVSAIFAMGAQQPQDVAMLPTTLFNGEGTRNENPAAPLLGKAGRRV